MATNLVMNVKNALTELPEPAVYGWLDSTVALHWILGKGLLNSHDLRRALRIQAWIRRFTTHRDRKGPLTSEDLREVRDWWIRRVQNLDSKKPQFTQTKNALNLIPNSEGILECRGRIQGMYSIPSSRLHVYQEAGSENPCKDPSRGSIAYNSHHSRELLDSKTQKAG